MAIKNHETGMYEEYYFHNHTGALIVGIGNTKEEARTDLKSKKRNMIATLKGSPREINSPGNEFFVNEQGRTIANFNVSRKVVTKCREDLIDTIKDEIINKNS